LNPNYGVGTANRFRNAYFAAGRYEDALRIVEQQPSESRTKGGWVQRAASYAALGRIDEARTATWQALAQHPDVSIQGHLSSPDFSDADRRQHDELMRRAGFPPCAKPEELRELAQAYYLPECAQVGTAK
jgi:tetratricopeptide (TPR) repeat protein